MPLTAETSKETVPPSYMNDTVARVNQIEFKITPTIVMLFKSKHGIFEMNVRIHKRLDGSDNKDFDFTHHEL